MKPQEVLAVRHGLDGTAERLIHWKNLLECEDSWELLQELRRQFPDSHLEDKVVVPAPPAGGGGWGGVVLRIRCMGKYIIGEVGGNGLWAENRPSL